MKTLSKEQVKRLQEKFGEEKVAAWQEASKALESGEFDSEPTKEEVDEIAKGMKF